MRPMTYPVCVFFPIPLYFTSYFLSLNEDIAIIVPLSTAFKASHNMEAKKEKEKKPISDLICDLMDGSFSTL